MCGTDRGISNRIHTIKLYYFIRIYIVIAERISNGIVNWPGIIGLTMVTEFDPTMNATSTISADFYNYFVLVVMLCSNMHYFIISAVCDSFRVVPVGGAVFRGDAAYEVALTFIQQYFVIAFRIALPIFITIMLCNIILGILAKTAPQMNMFAVGIELKLLLGLMVMVATVMFIPNITEYVYDITTDVVRSLIRTMY